ncbi:peptide/nickel transport system permease protein [Dendrosporobacter quercicolus]|uniref:Peptide/nickel transport system permease protein n=1 Tax=Dendrosporobacter quercicolus TaxID=146817 RepID=A0A1G9NGP4_9FIRM|nr:ABC transporter permease [Dendrosporobacter quercicolus]SDL85732.1 peptide/nickel transport system permease protein [Dendrosporobacter quercicolus]
MEKHRFKRWQVCLTLGMIILCGMIISIAGASFFSLYSPVEQNAAIRLEAPSYEHLLGTDHFGRDMLSRTLHGGKTTLVSTTAALTAALTIGLFIGLLTGMFHDTLIDIVFIRIIDVLMAFPFIVLAMVVTALFGISLTNLLLVVVAVWWVPFARLTRSIVLQAKNDTTVEAARVLGAKKHTIAVRELLPKAIAPVLIQATFEMGNLVLSISALSFLGLGAQPPAPEWGSMLADGRAQFLEAPHILMGPAIFIIFTVLALNLIGEGLRDWLDPFEILRI